MHQPCDLCGDSMWLRNGTPCPRCAVSRWKAAGNSTETVRPKRTVWVRAIKREFPVAPSIDRKRG